jgi:hypothetical protein
MTDGTEIGELDERSADEVSEKLPYVAPKLTSVGNVRDLLAGAQATGNDGAGPQTMGG